MHAQPNPLLQYLIPVLVIGLVLFLRFRSMGRARPLRLGTLWIVPAVYLALAVFLFAEMPPHGLGWLWAALALAVCGALGLYRGRSMQFLGVLETSRLYQFS